MRHLLTATIFTVVLLLRACPVSAQQVPVPPTNLDGLDLGAQIRSERASDLMSPDQSQLIGRMVATVWLKDGVYTYKFVVTPMAEGVNIPRQFLNQYNLSGFDPAVHKAGWSFTDAVAAGVSGGANTAFTIMYSPHFGLDRAILTFVVPPEQVAAGFWNNSGAADNRRPIAFFFQSSYAPATELNVYALAGPPANGTTLNYAPSLIRVTYDGKLRDRVGPGGAALAPDGAGDGTLTVTLSAANGRTITRLQLQSSAPGIWDTDAATSWWVLGVARTLESVLLNDPITMAVNVAVADGESLRLFAADYEDIEFLPGTTLTVTAGFSDGTTTTATVVIGAVDRPDPPSLTLTYDGKLADRVGGGSTALGADGARDGTLTLSVSAAGGATVTRLQLQSSAPGTWDTDAATGAWALGISTTLNGALLNDPVTMGVNVFVADGGSLRLFAADWANIEFLPGTTLTVTAVFSDGTTAAAATVVPAPPVPPSLALTYDGKLADRVGGGSTALGPDGAFDGTLTLSLSAVGGRTITRLQLQSSAPGSWDTDAASGAWALGVSTALNGALLNDPVTMAVNVFVPDGGGLRLFAADWANIEFVPGTTLTVTVVFSDGTTASAATVAAATPAPPSLRVTYDGKLADRVGGGSTALGPDGAFDGTLTVSLAAVGGRTITRLQLQSSAPGTWDTDAATGAWALGVSTTLNGALLNDPVTMAVNVVVADGGSLHLFAADWANIEFVPGTTLTVTAVFSDGTSAEGTVTVANF